MTLVLFLLGHIASEQGRAAEAVTYYSEALAVAASQKDTRGLTFEVYQAQNNVAWILATTSDPSLRNAQQAIALARRAVQLSGGREASLFDTLAVAYAAAGDFENAVTTAKEAIDLAESQRETQLADNIRQRLQLFKQSTPFVDQLPKNE